MAALQSEYGKKMVGIFNDTLVGISVAMGLKTGLFDVLLRAEQPLTSSELASRSTLKERYVREWLGSMLSAGVIDLDEAGSKYLLPSEKREALGFILRLFSFVDPVIASFPSMSECFRLEGPAGTETEGFRDAMAEFELAAMDGTIDSFLNNVPELQKKLESGIEVGEYGSNSGNILFKLAQRFPNSRFHGSDISSAAVKEANERVRSLSLKNISFHVVDLCRLPESWKAVFDWVYVHDVIHDLPHPEEGVKGLRQSLREGGICSVIDINAGTHHRDNAGKPMMGFLYTVSTFFCIPGALSQDADSPAFGAVWGVEKAKELFTSCGFRIVQDGPTKHNPLLYHYVLQK